MQAHPIRFGRRLAALLPALALASGAALAQPVTLAGDIVDYGYTDQSDKVCCVDVAAVNLLNYADRQPGNGRLVPDGKSIGDQQVDFHKTYDPGLTRSGAGTAELTKGLKDTLHKQGFKATVKSFGTHQLSYDTLITEWQHGEYIILNMREVDRGFGHSVFLWGMNLDKTTPSLGVADPNIEPNSDAATGAGGAVSWSGLSIGQDARGLPDWRIGYGTDPAYAYRVVSFVSVSDISPVPEPATWLLALGGAAVAGAGHVRRRRAV